MGNPSLPVGARRACLGFNSLAWWGWCLLRTEFCSDSGPNPVPGPEAAGRGSFRRAGIAALGRRCCGTSLPHPPPCTWEFAVPAGRCWIKVIDWAVQVYFGIQYDDPKALVRPPNNATGCTAAWGGLVASYPMQLDTCAAWPHLPGLASSCLCWPCIAPSHAGCHESALCTLSYPPHLPMNVDTLLSLLPGRIHPGTEQHDIPSEGRSVQIRHSVCPRCTVSDMQAGVAQRQWNHNGSAAAATHLC